mgnify:CR=1 FL=1
MPRRGGKVVIGDTIRFGYYTQDGISIKPGQKVIEVIRGSADADAAREAMVEVFTISSPTCRSEKKSSRPLAHIRRS